MKIHFFIILLALFACQTDPRGDSDTEIASMLMEHDRNFSKMSELKTMKEAFLEYAADDVIKLTNQQHPSVGIEALRNSFQGEEDFKLTWEPLKADGSCNLGYTFGNYYLKVKTASGGDSTIYGNYMTVWKKQEDGSWKFVLDGGNSTPGPTRF